MGLVDTRVIEGTDGRWIVQYACSKYGWNEISDDSFDTEEEAQDFLDEQIESADYDEGDEDDCEDEEYSEEI